MASAITLSQLYNTLRKALGDEDAEIWVTYVDMKLKEQNDIHMKTLATKEDLKNFEVKFEIKLGEIKTDLIKWLCTFLIPLLLAVVGLYLRK